MKPEFELDRRHHHIRNSIIIIHHHSHHHWHLVWISFASHCIFLVLWKNIEALLREYWLLLQLLICCSSNQFKHLKLVLESTLVAFVWRTIINPIFSLSCKLIVLRRQIRCKNGGLWTYVLTMAHYGVTRSSLSSLSSSSSSPSSFIIPTLPSSSSSSSSSSSPSLSSNTIDFVVFRMQ